LADGAALEALNDNGLAWSIAPNELEEVPAIVANVAETEANVRASLGLAPIDPIRVALVSPGDADGMAVGNKLVSTLVFNGMTAIENEQAGNFLMVTYAPGADLGTAINAVFSFHPHIAVVLGADDAATIIDGIWELKVPPLPMFVLSARGRTSSLMKAAMGKP